MCCFSRPVDRVEQTRIYARADDARQLVVYEMRLAVEGELAMVLPIPVAQACGEDAIEFVDLTNSPAFFRALEYAFRTEPEPQAKSYQPSRRGAPLLAVQQVGAFEASFVPRAEDFDRLDPRFSLPSSLWASVPAVRGFGFVVFKLRGSAPAPGVFDRMLGRAPSPLATAVHPMAFWFPRSDRARVFFPTLHVHDGHVHAEADFDHVLYAQTPVAARGWETSPHAFVDGMGGKGRKLVLAAVGQRRTLRGAFTNADTWIAS